MRKVWIGAISVGAIGLCAVVLLPVIFKDRLVGLVVDQVNQRANANVALGEVSVSALQSFPNLTVNVHDLVVTGVGAFDGVTLARLGSLSATVNLRSLMGDGPAELEALRIADGEINLITDAEGRSNTDIAPPGEPGAEPAAPAEPAEPPSPLSLKLRDYGFQHIDVLYDDQPGGTRVTVKDLNHSGSGELDGDLLHLATRTDMGALTVASGGMTWLDGVKVGSDLELDLNQATSAIRFGKNNLTLNELKLTFEGDLTPRGEDLDLDLKLSALETSFKGLLSLLPALYAKDFASLNAGGTFTLAAAVKGLLPAQGDELPSFNLDFQVNDGRFQVPDLPSAVEAVNLKLNAAHPGGLLDAMVVNVPAFAMTLAGSPITGKLRLAHIDTDPDVDLGVKANVDLKKLAAVYPVEGLDPAGLLDVDLDIAGRVSQFDGAMDGVRAAGHVRLTDAAYRDASLADPLLISRADLDMSPAALTLNTLTGTLGKTDLAVTGKLLNPLAYALTDAPLRGDLTVRSKLLDLDALMVEDEAAPPPAQADKGKKSAAKAPEGGSSLVAIPGDLDLSLDASADRVLYDDQDIRNAVAKLRVVDQTLQFSDLRMDVLGGTIGLKGSYAAKTDQAADVDMELTMATFEVAKTVAAFDTLAKLAPVAKKARGSFRSGFTMKARLNPDLSPDLSSLASTGNLLALGVALQPGFMASVAEAVKNKDFSGMDLGDTSLGFNIAEGQLRFDPTTVTVGGAKGTIKGKTGVLDETLDLVLDLEVPLSKIGATDLISKAGLGSDGVGRMRVLIGGTFDKPTVKVDLGKLTDKLEDTVQAGLAEGKAAVNDAVDTALAEAQKRVDQIMAEAQKGADRLRDEASASGDKLVAQAKKQAGKLNDDAAGNPIKEKAAKEAGDKLIKEAKQAASKLNKEADDKATALLDKARKQSDQILADAGQKAKIK